MLLDDVFSGMDAHTAKTVFSRLLGREGGLLRNHHTTVVLATHSRTYLAPTAISFVLNGILLTKVLAMQTES